MVIAAEPVPECDKPGASPRTPGFPAGLSPAAGRARSRLRRALQKKKKKKGEKEEDEEKKKKGKTRKENMKKKKKGKEKRRKRFPLGHDRRVRSSAAAALLAPWCWRGRAAATGLHTAAHRQSADAQPPTSILRHPAAATQDSVGAASPSLCSRVPGPSV